MSLIRILLFILIGFAFAAKAQLLQKADTAFAHGKYSTAIELYEKILKKNKEPQNNKTIYYKLGSSFYSINKYKEAKEWTEKAIEEGYSDPKAFLQYGEILTLQSNYTAAKNAFQEYQKRSGDNTVKSKIVSCDFALSGKKSAIPLEVKNITELNSPYSEFGLAFVNDEFIFASSRLNTKERQDEYTGQGFSDVYASRFGSISKKWKEPAKLKGGVNTNYNDGTFAYNSQGKIGYFMQCNGSSGNKENCGIFYSLYDEKENTWSKSKVFEYSNPNYNIGHPAITSDGNMLFFVSDMPGSVGGKDIWFISKKDGIWGSPVNAGNIINTSGNEVFPYVSGDSVLYFSSNQHPGYGGLDIFSVKLKNNTINGPVTNLLTPINSSADDFSIVFGKSILEGYFCSNRDGGVGQDDIYSFNRAPLILNAIGKIVDSETNKPVANVTVYFKGDNGIIDSITTGSSGEFNFKDLKPDLKYAVTAVKSGFFSDSKSISTIGVKENMEFSKKTGVDLDFGLLKISKKEIVIPNISYDFNQSELKQESKIELDKLARILIETPKVIIEISSHTDEKGADEYNKTLSQKRAQNVVSYLGSKGVPQNRMLAKGYGESQPLKKNAVSEEDHALNRRTTFKVIKNK
ncbi:MAG: OmpA family protein [Bacteroidetes bacterium]|nr:OmpA family protein [Bacteroidota bacterium]